MIELAQFFAWTYEAVGAWDGIRAMAIHVADAGLADTALFAAAGEPTWSLLMQE